MARTLVIQTPENVHLEYPLAGLGSRFVALALDTAIQGALVLLLVGVVLGVTALAGLGVDSLGVSVWASLGVGTLLVLTGYFLVFETLWRGQTPGKRLLGLRVLAEGGHPLDFRGSLIRNVVRVLDFLPGLYGLGVLFVFFHPECRRLGDLAAGTFVVREGDGGGESQAPPRDADPQAPLPVGVVPPDLLELAAAFLRRRDSLPLRVRAELAAEIAWRLRAGMGLEPGGPAGDWSDEALAETVLARRASQAGL